MKYRLTLLLFCLFLAFFLFNCRQELNLAEETGARAAARSLPEEDLSREVDVKLIRDRGIIKYIDLEGGFFGIIGKNGKYDPVNLPKAFQQDGLRVEFTARVCKDQVSFHMWGTLVELISMKTLRNGRRLIMDTGVIKHYTIQGGPWVIAATTDSYQILNLPEKFMVEGLEVNFVGIIRKDVVLIPALWPLVELLEIESVGGNPLLVQLNRPFKLQVTNSALEPLSGVLLTFKSVIRDSRCPTGVLCVWEGEAVVEVNIKIRGIDYGDFEMSTYDARIIDLGAYFIQFKDLDPYPAINIRIDPSQYVGQFVIGTYLEAESL